MTAIAKLRKALVALAIAGGGALINALSEASPGGDAIVANEWWAVLGFTLTAAGAVFLVPNAPTDAQRAHVVAELQRVQSTARRARQEPTQSSWPY